MNPYLLIFVKLIFVPFLVGVGTTDLWSQSEVGADSGSSFLLELKQNFYNSVEDSVSSLEPLQKLSMFRVYEKELDKARGKMTRSEYLEEKLSIANRYWEYRDFDGALSAYEKIASMEPGSRFAAKAYLMQGWIRHGNLGKPGLAISDLKKSVEILENLRKVSVNESHDYQINQLAGQALGTLGNVYFVDGKSEDSIKTYEYLLSQKDIVAASEESLSVNALSTLARQLLEKGDRESAIERFEALDKLVNSSTSLPAKMKIGFAMERMRAMSQTLSEKDLLEFLEDIWIAHKKNVCIETLRVGNTLVLAYFFSKDGETKKKFPTFQQEFQDFIKELRKSEDLKTEHWLVFYRVTQQTLILQAEYAEMQKEKEELETAKGELKKVWEEKEERKIEGDFEVSVPTTFPVEVAKEILRLRTRHWPDAKASEESQEQKVAPAKK